MAFFTGLIAAFAAWIINRSVVNRWGDLAVAYIVPVAEEILKTLIAIIFGASIFYAHFSFGVIEAIWDMKVNTKGFRPAIFSLLTHSIFGFITIYIFWLTGFLIFGIIISIITHIIWNSYIIRRSS
ncbi:MAG: hypothetical protein VR72_01725 [Clostridiaceae bacterium BRH_c20a]|nr:MAG: hypothetical protein VR72_01725 [Clostridiaceae bacterium BRH_c20a]